MSSRRTRSVAESRIGRIAAVLALGAALFGPLLLPLHEFGPGGHAAPAAAVADAAFDAQPAPTSDGDGGECRVCTLLHATHASLCATAPAAAPLAAAILRLARFEQPQALDFAPLLLDSARAPPASV